MRATLLVILIGLVLRLDPSVLAVDSDGDGQTDEQELAAGTDPNNDLSVLWRNLASWRFSDTNLMGNAGQLPLISTNVTLAAGRDGNGGRLVGTNGPVILKYRAVETNGAINLAPKRGSIWFAIKPDWFSDDPSSDGSYTSWGHGPGEWVTILETTNFSLRIDPPGLNLVLDSRLPAGGTTNNLTKAIRVESLTFRPNRSDPGEALWYYGLLNYSPEGTKIYWNSPGNATPTGPGIAPPTVPAGEQFLSIGSAADGTGAIQGVMDDVFSFNAPGVFSTNMWQASAMASNAPAGIQLIWSLATNSVVDIKRRVRGEANWKGLGAAIGTNYFDATAVEGVRYEYNLNTRFSTAFGDEDVTGLVLNAARNANALENRGKILLLIDETLTNQIAAELGGFVTNLVGDGWQVIRGEAPRHIDDYSTTNSYRTNYSNITNRIAPFIRTNYAAYSTNLKQILIVGHVTVPYSGTRADDGHNGGSSPHQGAWTSDIYYGDVDGVWTDTRTVVASLSPWNLNYPNDGKFDQDWIPTNAVGVAELEIPVSRIDFANLPAFAPDSEVGLLRKYFAKDAAFRTGQNTFDAEALQFDTPVQGQASMIPAQTAALMAGQMAVLRPTLGGDPFADARSALVGAVSGPGGFDSINSLLPQEHSTAQIAAGNTSTNVAFYYIRSSYMPDWNSTNNFMRAVLGIGHGGLTTAGQFWPQTWRLGGLGVGDTMGSDVRDVVNHWPTTFISIRSQEILGDATLRYPVLVPPGAASWALTNDRVHLTWSHPSGITPKYQVYRSTNGILGGFTRISPAPVSGTNFTDAAVPAGLSNLTYMVRAVALAETGGGSFTNISQGVFVTGLPAIDPFSCCIADQTGNEDAPLPSVNFELGQATNEAGLTVTAVSSNPSLIPNENLTLGGSGNARTLTLTAVTNQFGTALISITVATAVSTNYKDFVLTVKPVNDPPSFAKGTNIAVVQHAGPQSFPDWATNILAGPTNESAQVVTFNVSTDRPYLFAAGPAVDSTGKLTFTPSVAGRGTATVTVQPMDDGGTADGGLNLGVAQNFTISIGTSTDSDGDRMPDDFELAYGLDPQNKDDGPTDVDGDGFSNLQEFWAGTDPRDSRSFLGITSTSAAGGGWRFSYATVQGRNYSIEYNDNFPTGSWNTLIPGLPGTGGSIELADLAGHAARTNRIYRIRTADSGGNIVTSESAGFWRFPLLGLSDTLLSMPFFRPPASRGVVENVSSNVLQIGGDAPWASNRWAYASETQTNTYFLLIASGTMEGSYYTITGNGSNRVTVDLQGETLAGVVAGNRVMIVPYWTMGSIFPAAAGIHPSQVAGTRLSEVFFPNLSGVGVNLGPSRILYYKSTWRQVGQGVVNKDDDVVLPDMPIWVRHNVPEATEITAHGLVLPTKLRIALRRETNTKQDIIVALPRPAPVSLEQSGLIESAAFRTSITAGTRVDEIYTFRSDTPVINRAPSDIFYYRSDNWRRVGSGNTNTNDAKVFQPGSGVFFRLDVATNSAAWINAPNY